MQQSPRLVALPVKALYSYTVTKRQKCERQYRIDSTLTLVYNAFSFFYHVNSPVSLR